MWFHVIQAFQGSNMPLPVNIKLIIEFMNHENSLGLSGFLQTRLQDFFAGVYNVVVCASQWIGPKHPCLIYGCVGQYFDGQKDSLCKEILFSVDFLQEHCTLKLLSRKLKALKLILRTIWRL